MSKIKQKSGLKAKCVKFAFDIFFRPFVRPLFKEMIKDRNLVEKLKTELDFMAVEHQIFGGVQSYTSRSALMKDAVNTVCDSGVKGTFLEFGVWKGASIRRLAHLIPEKKVFGFDSFEGLPSPWKRGDHTSLKPGKFDLDGELPCVPDNVKLIQGWFNQTLPVFLKEHTEKVAFVHIDSDIYESAKYLLEILPFQDGTVILFDEYFGYSEWKNGEYKAFQEFLQSNPHIHAECLGYAPKSGQAAFKLKM